MTIFSYLIAQTDTTTEATSTAAIETLMDFILKGGVMMIPIGLCSLVALAVFIERMMSLRRNKIIPPSFLPGLMKVLGDVKGNGKEAIDLVSSQENQSRHDEAIESYRKVVNRHQGETAARAQFQIGECLYALKRFDEAATELLKVDIHYAYPKWSAASLYETGRCFQEMANPVEARRQFENVVKNHADTDWAQLAAQRLKEMANVSLPGHASGDST